MGHQEQTKVCFVPFMHEKSKECSSIGEGGIKTMYNPQASIEKQGLGPGISATGVIVKIDDGKTSDFVKNTENWKGDIQAPAINVCIEIMHNNEKYELQKLFNYKNEGDKTVFSSNSNLGKYKQYYNKLPEAGDQVKCLTNKDGFFRLLIE